jgi:hypothetical protein
MGAFIDRTGKKYGRLTAVRRIPNNGEKVMWECLCDCGNTINVASPSLSGNTTSCGCAQRDVLQDRNFKHGRSRTKEFNTWSSMIARCTNPRCSHWDSYGGRGISIHEPWRNSFSEFFQYVGAAPSKSHTLDRIDNSGNYEPGNVRWATISEQNRNKRSNRLITHDGITLPMCDWATKVNISYNALRFRLNKGWSIERALTERPRNER